MTEETRRNRFNSLHEFREFIENKFINGSGVIASLLKGCIEFHQDVETSPWGDVETPIHEELGWKYTRFGFQANEPLYAAFLKNEDGTTWQAVLSIWDEDRQRPYRYYAPKDIGDRAFLPPIPKNIRKLIGNKYGVEVPEDGSFWEWLKTQNKIPKVITEGAGKSLSLLSQGYIGIALYGCSCGGRIDKYGLIEDLKQFNQEESIWLFGLDRDASEKTKRRVNSAKKQLKLTLESDGVPFYIEDVFWRAEDGKGVDDLIVNKGSGAFDTAYHAAMARLEKQFKDGGYSSENDKDYKPSQVGVAREIAEKYRGVLAYNNEISSWMRYGADNDGMWSRETDEYVEAVIYQIILSEGYKGFSSSFVSAVTKLLRHELIERNWNERLPNDLLPFRNGVLEIKTGKLLDHAPGYRLTWQLPRNYETGGTFDKINKFLDDLSAGNSAIKDLLLCFCNAVIKGRADLQKFLHLIGLGGTGKGTFSRLITSLIGEENIHTTSLEEWCKDKFEPANAYRKRLVVFPDEDRQTGKIGKFLSLTGEDYLRAEEKHKTAFKFKYDGMVMVLSNLPIFGGESASRVKRRVLTVPCNNVCPVTKRKNLEKDFEPELAAFTNHVLTISDDHVTSVLMGIQEIPECTLEFWENRMRVDSIAAWINQSVIHDPEAQTAIGFSKHEGSDGGEILTLFGSYSRHCYNLGDSPKSHKNFSPDLLELCKSVLNWPVEKVHTNTGKFIRGLKLRIPGIHDHIPTYDVWLNNRVTVQVTVDDGSSDGSSDGSEPLPHKESDGCDGSEVTMTEISENKTEHNFKVGDFVLVDGSITQIAENIGCHCRILNGEQWHYSQLELQIPQTGIEILRECDCWDDWGLVESLTAAWCESFKDAVWKLLTSEEKSRIKSAKKIISAPNPGSSSAIVLPILEPNKEYFSAINQQTVKVITLHDYLELCHCAANGKKLACDFGDLRVLPNSQKLEADINDRVEILSGKYRGKKATISSQLCEHGPVYLRIEGVRSSVSCKHKFWGHQIRKI
ncbi:DUF3854 domain-containing protein [Sphaerospermopsis sp. LEGE 08334]|uniref:DUF3854 domain-containing protein n=1 Tax=Sphaerospermopsis sp. LEGE 08334 TaxID=1828651 RepID=UPI0028157269|nr:DUF3854 domain-containing protein [Sphaerospermopsis sp. LEGE 08334]